MTGDFAPRKGKGIFEFNIGGLSVLFAAWVAEVQDPCILRLDFLKAVGGVLDLGKDSLTLPGGRLVKLTLPLPQTSPHCPYLLAWQISRAIPKLQQPQ